MICANICMQLHFLDCHMMKSKRNGFLKKRTSFQTELFILLTPSQTKKYFTFHFISVIILILHLIKKA